MPKTAKALESLPFAGARCLEMGAFAFNRMAKRTDGEPQISMPLTEESSLSTPSGLRSNGASVMHVVGSLEGGGAERWVRELAPRLRARDVPIEIVTIYPPRLDGASLKDLGCEVFFRRKRPGFDLMHLAWLYRLMRQRKPTIVHTHQWAGKYLGRSAAILARTPIIVHTEHSPLPVGRAERILTNVLSRRTDAVIAFNEQNVGLIRERERVARFEIIRNGLPIPPAPTQEARSEARHCLSVSDECVVFGFVASLQERKKPELALRAFAQVHARSKRPARLDFFGDGPLRQHLTRLADALHVSKAVNFHGFRPDVRAYLPGLDVFVTVATQEMAPISMLEAMAARLPIIGTPHPGTLEMVKHEVTGLVVDFEVESVAAAMEHAIADEGWRNRCGLAGRALVERDYDIETIADQHVALYERLSIGKKTLHVARS